MSRSSLPHIFLLLVSVEGACVSSLVTATVQYAAYLRDGTTGTQRGITLANSRRNAAEGSELYYAGGIDHVTRKTPRTHAYSYCDAILGT